MNRSNLLLVMISVTLLTSLGCGNSKNVRIEMLEHENRMLEDKIFELEASMLDASRMGYGCETSSSSIVSSEPSTSKKSSPSEDSNFPSKAKSGGSNFPFPKKTDDSNFPGPVKKDDSNFPKPPAGSGVSPPHLGEPINEPPPGLLTPGASTAPFKFPNISPPGTVPEHLEPAVETSQDVGLVSPSEVSDLVIDQVEIVSRETYGVNTDGKPGDEGLKLVLQCRNQSKHVIPIQGNLSVVVLDPSKKPSEARVGRWDYTEADVLNKRNQNVQGHNLEIEVLWANEIPDSNQLMLHAKLITDQGKELRVQAPIRIARKGEVSQSWSTAKTPLPKSMQTQPPKAFSRGPQQGNASVPRPVTSKRPRPTWAPGPY